YVRRLAHPSLGASSLVTLTGHFASPLYAVHPALSALSASAARTSATAIHESPSGVPRIVASPRTAIVPPAGAMNELPAVVVFGVSAAIVSVLAGAGAETAVL